MKPLFECRLYAFVDTSYLLARRPEAIAQELCDGGADLIQLRAKKSSPQQIREMAQQLLPITSKAGVGLVINDHPEIAQQIKADFCHLGQKDFFDSGHTHVSEFHGPVPLRIGLSTHAPEHAERAVAAGADYIAIGPVYATATKPNAKPVTLEYVRWAAANIKIPWFAIGGINLNNLDKVLAAGATRVCIVSAILNSPGVANSCRSFKERLLEAG